MDREKDHPLAGDLDHIIASTRELWNDLRGGRLFITGGTGFVGTWLLESFAWANRIMGLKASAVVLTRNYAAFKGKVPHLAADPAINFHSGDIQAFTYPGGEFSHIIHAAATSALATFNKEDPLAKFATVVDGTRHTLDFAVHCHARKLLLTSSGAVYGKQPYDMPHITEICGGGPDPCGADAAWGESKRAAEFLCAQYSRAYGFDSKIARCFSFLGPYLQLNVHYAVGNFIRDAINGGPICIRGDGTQHRSYMYAADLVIWLWKILIQGESRHPYNVGSEEDVTIAELANRVAQCFDKPIEITMAKKPASVHAAERYVPSTRRAQQDLGLQQCISLREGIERTVAHVRAHPSLYFR